MRPFSAAEKSIGLQEQFAALHWVHVVSASTFWLFMTILCGVLASSAFGMFLGRFGRRHRVVGLLYLLTLLFGLVISTDKSWQATYGLYDVALGVLGVATTLTAASDFGKHHADDRVKNPASGALDRHATITVGEMVEHAFYQGLNLLQVSFFHLSAGLTFPFRVACGLAVSLPWLWRSSFPVNSFSANYAKELKREGHTQDSDEARVIADMYRLKKYQYVFYKHFLLHGMNASVAVSGVDIANHPSFRLYWWGLNAAYTMEFFLQSLVKRKYLRQEHMLRMNQLLMVGSTFAAVMVLTQFVMLAPALLSLFLQFANRGREVTNAAATLVCAAALHPFH